MLEHYKTTLSPRAYNQVASSITDPDSCQFNQAFIKPYLVYPDNQSCITIAQSKDVMRLSLASQAILDGRAKLQNYSFFTNPILDVDVNDPLRAEMNCRVVVNPFVTLTLEFDDPQLSFFEQQLGWARGKRDFCPLFRLSSELRAKYHDFRGLTANLSGNKSIHYHFTFATDHLATRDYPIDGYGRAWKRLEDHFIEFFQLPMRSDAALRNAGSFRRLPCGTRVLDKANIFGMPIGTKVPQAVIFDEVFARSAKGASTPFLKDQDFATESEDRAAKITAAPVTKPTTLEAVYIDNKMKEFFPEGSYPEFVDFTTSPKGKLRARFLNSGGDSNPSSYMEEGYSSIMICGNNPNCLKTPYPAFTKNLEDMIEQWKFEHSVLTNSVTMTRLPALPFGRQRTPVEDDFAWQAKSLTDATDALSVIIKDESVTFDRATATLISAPEGISKTRSIIENTRYIMSPAKKATECLAAPIVMFAFASYEAAEEKMAEFDAYEEAHPAAFRLAPVLIRSFSKLYDDWLSAYQAKPITLDYAEARGYRTLETCIEAEQPEALSFMRDFYTRQRNRIEFLSKKRKAFPVFFTVHAIAQEWHQSSRTRLMFSPAFWVKNVHQAREETAISLLIHDEVSPGDLVYTVPKRIVDYVQTMKLHGWSKDNQLSNYTAYHAWAEQHPLPMMDRQPLTFHEACRIADMKFDGTVTIKHSGEYERGPFEEDIYEARVGNEWCFARRGWTQHQRTILLTTECVATALARWCQNIDVIELDTPRIKRDPVSTYPTRLSSETTADHVEEFRRNRGPITAVGNKLTELPDTKSHHAAKGSNAYMGLPMLQTMVMMAPHQWEQYEVYNALTSRDNLIRLRHIDEYNQTAGRNLGFRYRSGAEHHLIINRRLYKALQGEPLETARYEMVEQSTSRQRYKRKARQA